MVISSFDSALKSLRQLVDFDDLATAQYHRPLDGVFEFTYVSRPRVLGQRIDGFGRETDHFTLILFRVGAEEVGHQKWYILVTITQRRQFDGDDIQPVVESSRKRPAWTSAQRSTLDAATNRTSTGRASTPPTRRISRSWITRRSLVWVSALMVPTSSRKRVPSWAASKSPFRQRPPR